MSFFSINGLNGGGNQEINEEKVRLAEIQMTAQIQTTQNLMKSCLQKCIPHEYGEADLNKGESVCIDRCVSKFFKANLLIGQYVQSHYYSNPANLPQYQNLPLRNDE